MGAFVEVPSRPSGSLHPFFLPAPAYSIYHREALFSKEIRRGSGRNGGGEWAMVRQEGREKSPRGYRGLITNPERRSNTYLDSQVEEMFPIGKKSCRSLLITQK